MRFKIIFDEATRKIVVNCLKDKNEDIILPENPEQHVYFPFPPMFFNKVNKAVQSVISEEDNEEFIQIMNDIQALNQKRRDKLNEIRTRLNPEIMKACEQFKLDNAEEFI